MKHQEIILFALIISLTFMSCGWNPRFSVYDNCIETVSGKWFMNVYIEVKDDNRYYTLERDHDLDGSHVICFGEIPAGYVLTRFSGGPLPRDTFPFQEGETVIISYSGGDRAGVDVECTVINGMLRVKELE